MKNTQKNALTVAGEHIAEGGPSTDLATGINLGIHIGIGRALHVIRAITEVGQAREIKKLKDSGDYRHTGLNWKQFCAVHLGVSQPTADAAIENLDKLGENYFAVSKFVPISPGTFGLIEGKIDSDGMEIDGEKVSFTAANATRIKRAIESIRKQAKDAQAEAADAKNKADLATNERDNAKKAAATLRSKVLDLQNPKAFADADDDDHKLMLDVQSRVDVAFGKLETLRGQELSADNKRRYGALCKYLYYQILSVVNEAQVELRTYLDPPEPGIELFLGDPATDRGQNLLAEHAKKGGK